MLIDKFFHWHIHKQICNKAINKDSNTLKRVDSP